MRHRLAFWDIKLLLFFILMDPENEKLLLVSIIHLILIYILIKYKYKMRYNYLNNEIIKYFLLTIFFILFFILNKYLYNFDKYILYLVHAAFLTVWYIELAIHLEKFFWRKFLQDQLPFSINLLLSFVLMINAGYFTLMFIIRILETDKLI